MKQFFLVISVTLLASCAATTHETVRSPLGRPSTGERVVEAGREPGPVEFRAVTAATWAVPRSGMINLDHPRAEAAGLEDDDEPVVIQFFELRHPLHGTYMVDSGVASSFRSAETAPVSWLVEQAMNFDELQVRKDTRQWLDENQGKLDGVFLTHLHLDHIMGLPDIPGHVPVYTGPGEAEASQLVHAFSRGTTDELLEGTGPLREWPFVRDPSGRFAGVVDVFGDESVFALHAPGHTPGSTAYLVRTPSGPQLITGDVSHTAWGWKHRVEPGWFTMNAPRSVTSLAQLKTLAHDLPGVVVHLGHQHLDEQVHPLGGAVAATRPSP